MEIKMEIRIGDIFKKIDGKQFDLVRVTNVYTIDEQRKIEIPKRYEKIDRIMKHKDIKHSNKMIEYKDEYNDRDKFTHSEDIFEKYYVKDRDFREIEDEHIKPIFEFFVKQVFNSGGDGNGVLITKNYDFRKLANKFGEHEFPFYAPPTEAEPHKIEGYRKIKDCYCREDYPDRVHFSDMSNENFSIQPFLGTDNGHVFDDIVIVF